MAANGGFFKYVKKAFTYHWNLLAVGVGVALGIISGKPDIILPFVVASEIVFLAALSTNRKFQAAIDAEEHKAVRGSKVDQAALKSQTILASLSSNDRRKYEKLKSLCIQLRRIARGVRAEPGQDLMIDDMQSTGVNRLLWIYLKLLYSKNSLERFFSTIDENEIENDIQRAGGRMEALGPLEEDTPGEIKRRKSLKDTLETSELRLKNYLLAKENYEFIELELDRLYSKIASLSELSINRQDPDFITKEVDSVSASIHQTEKAMNELEFITGLSTQDETPPALLDEESIEIR